MNLAFPSAASLFCIALSESSCPGLMGMIPKNAHTLQSLYLYPLAMALPLTSISTCSNPTHSLGLCFFTCQTGKKRWIGSMLMCLPKLCGSVTFHQLGLVHRNLVVPHTRVPNPLSRLISHYGLGTLGGLGTLVRDIISSPRVILCTPRRPHCWESCCRHRRRPPLD